MTEFGDRYRRRADAFETLIASTPASRWSWPSPCDDWDARGVVEHVVVMHGVMLRPLDREPRAAPSVGDDPLAAFRAARADVEAVLDDPVLATSLTETPAGELPAEEMIDQVVSQDMVFHAWDLAKATGQDDTIDADEVAAALPVAERLPPEMHEPGAFRDGLVVYGPVVEVARNAPAQHRLLGLLGRDPWWTNPQL
jgi:uncharacterized protein (TIGR03086 family)